MDALAPAPSDTVVEIGPGRGALTEALLPRVGRLVAVELDRALAAILRERYASDPRVTIVESDILQTALGDIGGDDFLLVGNVPYYITTPIIFHMLDGVLPRRAVFLVQREVADRATAPAGGRTYGALSVNLQVVADVARVFDIPPGAFRPPPKVESSVIVVTPLAQPLVLPAERRAFQRFVQSMFSQRRKQVGTILRSLNPADQSDAAASARSARVGALGIDPTTRPERLTPEQFVALFRAVRESE